MCCEISLICSLRPPSRCDHTPQRNQCTVRKSVVKKRRHAINVRRVVERWRGCSGRRSARGVWVEAILGCVHSVSVTQIKKPAVDEPPLSPFTRHKGRASLPSVLSCSMQKTQSSAACLCQGRTTGDNVGIYKLKWLQTTQPGAARPPPARGSFFNLI